MGESENGDSTSWQRLTDYFAELRYSKFINREKPLPSWSDSDVDAFISQDPVHGPVLRTAREVAKFGLVGTGIGAISTAGMAWKYSRSPHGAVLAVGVGTVFGWSVGYEIAKHWLQLQRLDTVTAQSKFLEWWDDKNNGTNN